MQTFLTSALDGPKWSDSRSFRFNPGEIAPDTHWIGCYVALSKYRRFEEKNHSLPGIEPSPSSQ
jgi:hypothetical protein